VARQYFNAQSADSLIVAASITPGLTKTSLFTVAQSNQVFPIGFGQAAPFAGQVYRFAAGGLVTTPTAGTMTIDPYHGPGSSPTSFGTDMGASAAVAYTPSLTNALWRMEGEIVYRSISAASTSSTAWLTGVFYGLGVAGTQGNAWIVPFGSTAAVSVDTSGLAANLFGALNFAFTFSVTGATISAQWTSMQSLN
jgi:hypothetical protein